MGYRPRRMKFGIFLAPFHQPGENPTLALERDAALIEELDRLGYDEAWIGEHHSVGWEFIPDPALFAAHMAARTKQIKLGTGVVSLPYHNPLMVADRMMFLDHLTRGRALFGVGPGALASDAYMMGIDPSTQRTRMVESLDAILPLLRGEHVTMETDWFSLHDAHLQLSPYREEHLPVSVAHSLSPSGPQTAGRFGIGMLSVATAAPGGIGSLQGAWQWAEEAAEEHGTEISRDDWRVTMYFHLADSKEEAMAQTAEGCIAYNQGYTGALGVRFAEGEDTIEAMVARGGAIVGTPDDAIEGHRAACSIYRVASARCSARCGSSRRRSRRGAASSCSRATSCHASRARSTRSRDRCRGRRATYGSCSARRPQLSARPSRTPAWRPRAAPAAAPPPPRSSRERRGRTRPSLQAERRDFVLRVAPATTMPSTVTTSWCLRRST